MILLGFFETYVKLSEEEEQQLQREVKTMETKEKEKVLELIISYEQKGRKEGMKEGMRRLIETMARKGMTNDEIARLVDLPVEEIERLL
ncbi:transposase [Geobacillus stearothermophilus]|uniref:transposase n=2 Tax=Geobacillus TaxID=129337 RepID=UPI002E1E307D|nr:transposase [Geobacillus stearothermophilus]MED3752958.1 transposase [Geobacillus stearothermophilus]MED3768343.1 transposase [Geobacillus stearothermophilus]MED3771749.1 transposase [Geobacillus stearothermophilus]